MSRVYRPEQKVHEKVWGKELWICNTPLYCGKILYLKKGFRCSIHHHFYKDEHFYLLSGRIYLEIGGEKYTMEVGDAIHVPPGLKHRFTGILNSEILEVSTQHFEDDSYRTTQSERCSWFKKNIVDKWRKARGQTDEQCE